MKNFVQPGDAITVAAPANVNAGAGVLIGSLFGVALTTALSGASVEIQTTGVVDITKAPSQAWTVGALIYWDAANNRATNVASTNKLIGLAVAAVAGGAGDTIGRVRLNGAGVN
ncbi:MAG: DUF2190 family protein [Rhodobacteraceae bacterium]|jgi:predicted RecA/RadA family phage recombinase|nr:DUF2190 family protein [Paracoccaceae bacterium]